MSDLCRKLFFCCAPNRSKVDYDNVLADSEREAVADLLNYLRNGERDEHGLPTRPGRYVDAKGDKGWYLDSEGIWNSGIGSIGVSRARSWPSNATLAIEAAANGWLPLTRIED